MRLNEPWDALLDACVKNDIGPKTRPIRPLTHYRGSTHFIISGAV